MKTNERTNKTEFNAQRNMFLKMQGKKHQHFLIETNELRSCMEPNGNAQ